MTDVQLTGWWYLSFVGDVEGKETFLGGAIVKCDQPTDFGIVEATCEAHRLGINPGGQVMGVPIPEGFLAAPGYRERLLTKKEINEFWPDAKRIGDMTDDSGPVQSEGSEK